MIIEPIDGEAGIVATICDGVFMDEYKERNRKIQEEHLQGKNLYQLSKEYGVCVERIRTICKQQLRKEKRDKNELFVLLFSLTDNEQLATKACTVLRRAHADSKEEVVKLDSAKLRKMRGCGAKMEELIMKAIEVIRKEGAYVTTAKEYSAEERNQETAF